MTRDQSMRLIALCGQALYGDQWQSQLARELGVDVRTVQRWAAGTQVPRSGHWREIAQLIDDNARELDALRVELETGITVE